MSKDRDSLELIDKCLQLKEKAKGLSPELYSLLGESHALLRDLHDNVKTKKHKVFTFVGAPGDAAMATNMSNTLDAAGALGFVIRQVFRSEKEVEAPPFFPTKTYKHETYTIFMETK